MVDSHDRSEDYTPIYEEDDHFSGVASATVTLDSRGNTVEIATHSGEKGARKQLSPRERKSTNKRMAHEEEEKIHHVYNSPAKRYVPAPNQYAHFGNQIDCAVKAQAANPKRYSGVTSSKTSKPGSAGKKQPIARSPSLLATGSLEPSDEKYHAHGAKHLPGGQHFAHHFLPTINGGVTPLTHSEQLALLGKRNSKKTNPKKKRKLLATANTGLHIVQPSPSTYAYPASGHSKSGGSTNA